MTAEYILYGTALSLYTAKLRAFLNYKKIPFREVLATDKLVKNILVPNTGVEYLPVVLTPQGEYLQDTSVIIDYFEKAYPARQVLPRQGLARFVSRLLELFGDEWLIIPAMHYRWNFSANSVYLDEAFGALAASRLPKFAQRIQGRKMASICRTRLPNLGITALMAPAIEAWYEADFLPALDRHFQIYDFILGARPSLGDFAFFGPLYAHLYQDPLSGKRMRIDAPHVARWIERLKHAQTLSDSSARLQLSKTLSPILKRIMREQLPVLIATVAAVAAHFESGAQEVPRTLGRHSFNIGDSVGERAAMPFLQWKLQRVLESYTESSADVRRQIDAFLGKIQGDEFTKISIPHRLVRQHNKLFYAEASAVSPAHSN